MLCDVESASLFSSQTADSSKNLWKSNAAVLRNHQGTARCWCSSDASWVVVYVSDDRYGRGLPDGGLRCRFLPESMSLIRRPCGELRPADLNFLLCNRLWRFEAGTAVANSRNLLNRVVSKMHGKLNRISVCSGDSRCPLTIINKMAAYRLEDEAKVTDYV